VKGIARQFSRFVTVGVTNSIVDFGVFNLLFAIYPTTDIQVLVLYNSLAVALAILNSYLWNTRWTFRSGVKRGPRGHRQRVLFLLQALLNVGVNDIVVAIITRLLLYQTFLSPTDSSNLAKLVAMLVASLSSFLIMKYVVYTQPRTG
jgi:putative flippase GtrA